MKRYVCTVAAGLVLALVSTGTATASVLPVLGQSGTQVTSFGDQTVGEQHNDAGVTQKQGNGNVNIAPAIALFGDAETTNHQGNGNQANASVTQSNEATQSQSSSQTQSLEQTAGSCCSDPSQVAEQTVNGGDQTIGEQSNTASVEQWQGNGNVNIAPAIAVFGDAETVNYQGNGNRADASVTQSNQASQSQSATQEQRLSQGGQCCKPTTDPPACKGSNRCEPHDWNWESKRGCCERGQSQTGEQHTSFGDQTVGEQTNDATVTQKQGNGNVNLSPAVGFGGSKEHGSCRSKCHESWKPKPSTGDASTTNVQGNGNAATAHVGQSNSAEQSQVSHQRQSIVDMCKGLVYR